MAVSVKDVAKLAGVSVGTVSNVLNRPTGVRPQTRERVEGAIAQLGFIRNDSARQLRAGRSRMIGYVVLDAANPFFTDVARGIDEGARAEGLVLFLADSHQDADREDQFLEQFLEQRVRGVCITPVDSGNRRLLSLTERGVPVVMVDRAPASQEDRWCSVGVDDVLGGELAARHLLDLGHERIAYAGDSRRLPQSVDRLAGVRRALASRGMDEDHGVVLHTEGMRFADGRSAAARLLALPRRRRPRAVVCGNDLLALGVLQQVIGQGLRVPADVAIVGYDDIEFAAAAAVPLTSVVQPRLELGRAAARLLLREEDEGPGHVHEHVSFEPALVVRASTVG